jgi:hypothetical protein
MAHYAARRIARQALRRTAFLRLLPGGLLAFLLAESALLALRELRARPEVGRKLWQAFKY